jgi:16S rRNA (uracil1498-N3)-methyltransferase
MARAHVPTDRLRRLFALELPREGGPIVLDAAAARHARVLRLSTGDRFMIFDGRGRLAAARIVKIDDTSIEAIAETPENGGDSGPSVVLVQALAKGDKMDAIVRMSTELGARAIHLATTEHSVLRLDEERGAKRLERLERIAREAARQSERNALPAIAPPAPLIEIADRPAQGSLRLVLSPRASLSIAEACRGGHDAWIAIGPEGGFSTAEITALTDRNWQEVGLGRGILRVETAAPIALALVLSALGGLQP